MNKFFIFLYFCLPIAALASPMKSTLAYQHYSKGIELAGKKKYEDALKSFQMAIDLNPSYIASYSEYARAATLLGKRKSALEKLTTAINFASGKSEREKLMAERDNLSEIFYTNETFQNYQNGMNFLRLNQSNNALEAFEKALKTEPDNLLILTAYADALKLEDRTKEAADILEQAVMLNDRKREARYALAELVLEQNPERTIFLLKPILLDSSDEFVSILHSRALSQTGKNSEAIDFLLSRSERHQNWIFSQYWLGKFYSTDPTGGWNARKHLMTFIKRYDSKFAENKNSEINLDAAKWKDLRTDAEHLLERVNKLLE